MLKVVICLAQWFCRIDLSTRPLQRMPIAAVPLIAALALQLAIWIRYMRYFVFVWEWNYNIVIADHNEHRGSFLEFI